MPFFTAGPPGIPAGLYIDHMSITTYSARVIWTIGPETDRGSPIFGYDIEAETQYYPGVWNLAAPGTIYNEIINNLDILCKIDLAVVMYWSVHPHWFLSFVYMYKYKRRSTDKDVRGKYFRMFKRRVRVNVAL